MVRIAKIKFSGYTKVKEYLCPDKKIEEGDVVLLEGVDNPAFVYEIAEVNDNDCNANKRVLSKAIENKNVTLSSKYMDITKANTECIVNSLGTNIKEFGNICYSIFYASESKELENFINNNTNGKVFDIIVTDAGKLPSKHIINIVMPYKYQDKNNEQLRQAFSMVIDKAIELKYESIAIPYIGTGANGYSYNDIHKALNDVMFNYQYKQGISIDILSVRFHSIKRSKKIRDGIPRFTDDANENGLINDYRRDNSRKLKKEFTVENYFDINNVSLIQDAIRRNYKKEDEINVESLYNPADFIRKALKNAGGCTQVPLFNTVLNNDAIKNIARFSKIIKKEEIYSTAYMLKLNFTQIIQYMEISGYTFSPVTKNNLDIEVFKFIVNNNGFTKSDIFIDDYFYAISEKISDIVINYEAPKRKKKKEDAIAM